MSRLAVNAALKLSEGVRLPAEAFAGGWRDAVRAARRAGTFLVAEAGPERLAELAEVLDDEKADEVGGVVLFRGGDLTPLKPLLVRGLHLLVGPELLEDPSLGASLKSVPVDHCLVGDPTDDARLDAIVRALAEVKGLTREDVVRVTNLNAHRLFGIGEVDQTTKIAYRIRNSLYLNVTNRCSNRCVFCAKWKGYVVKGHQLRLDREPDVDEVMRAIDSFDASSYDEVVFCGYGEPLLRLDLVKDVARRIKARGLKVRVNTDGQASLVYGRDVVPELVGLVDAVSVSLNASDAETYQDLCKSKFGADRGFEAVQGFIRSAAEHLPEAAASAVAVPGLDMVAAETLARSLGAEFRYREYNEVG